MVDFSIILFVYNIFFFFYQKILIIYKYKVYLYNNSCNLFSIYKRSYKLMMKMLVGVLMRIFFVGDYCLRV